MPLSKLEVIDLSHKLPGDTEGAPLLYSLNCCIEKGQSVAIVGASGSGKTTLLSFLAGLDVATSGKVLIDDVDIAQLDEEARAQFRAQKVAFVFQNFQLIDGLTVLQNVCLPLELRAGLSDSAGIESRAVSWLERVGLAHRLQHRPPTLSGGEQQRVALARAFACEAPILFADEPTGSLDEATGAKVEDMLFELVKKEQQTLILVTHDHRLAGRCDRVLLLEGCRLVEQQKSQRADS